MSLSHIFLINYSQHWRNPIGLFPASLLSSSHTQEQIPDALLVLNDICTHSKHRHMKIHMCTKLYGWTHKAVNTIFTRFSLSWLHMHFTHIITFPQYRSDSGISLQYMSMPYNVISKLQIWVLVQRLISSKQRKKRADFVWGACDEKEITLFYQAESKDNLHFFKMRMR